MTKEEFAAAKDFWRLKFAIDDFRRVSAVLNTLTPKLPPDGVPNAPMSPLMYGAIAPIYVLYARPFTKCYGVEPFSRDDLVPDEFRELHDNNIALRNQAYGHRDAKGVELKQGMLLEHEVYMILKSEGEMAFAHSEPRSGVRVFQGINKLVAKLIETCQHKLVELKNSTGHHLPKLPGRYKLNITDETGPMWVRCTEEANWKHPPICAGGWVSIAEN